MKVRSVALIGASAIACVLAGAGAVRAQNPGATAIHVFRPQVPPGKPVTGNCWTTSIATNNPDAFRCMTGNSISDPCFSTSNPGIVVCDPDPTRAKSGFAMRVKGPLPAAVPVTGPIMPWLIQLRDGTKCSPITGTQPLVGKLVVAYGCSEPARAQPGTYVGLAAPLDTKYALWRARRVVYRAGAQGGVLVSSAPVPIAAVWR